MVAATTNAFDEAKLLIDKGSDVNARDQVCIVRRSCHMHRNGLMSVVSSTPCLCTQWEHCMHSVRANRAFVGIIHTHDNAHQTWTRVTSQYNKTALMEAAFNNASDVAKLLIDKGSDVNARDRVCIVRR